MKFTCQMEVLPLYDCIIYFLNMCVIWVSTVLVCCRSTELQKGQRKGAAFSDAKFLLHICAKKIAAYLRYIVCVAYFVQHILCCTVVLRLLSCTLFSAKLVRNFCAAHHVAQFLQDIACWEISYIHVEISSFGAIFSCAEKVMMHLLCCTICAKKSCKQQICNKFSVWHFDLHIFCFTLCTAHLVFHISCRILYTVLLMLHFCVANFMLHFCAVYFVLYILWCIFCAEPFWLQNLSY